MSTKKLLVLTAIFLGLLAFVVFFERKQPTSEERAQAKRNLVDFSAEEVTSVHLDRADQPAVELVKAGARWTLKAKPEGPADAVTADALLSDLKRLEVEGEVRTAFDPKELGLDNPKVKVTVHLAAGKALTVAFGRDIPGTNATAASEGGRFGAVKYAPMTTLAKPVDEFRSKQLTEVPQNEITRISIEKGASKVVAVREPAVDRGKDQIPERSDWYLESPVKDLANQAFLDQLLTDFMSARVSEFVSVAPADLAKVGLVPPQAVISVSRGAEVVSSVSFGAAKAETTGKIYARRGDLFFLVDDRLNDNLAKEFSAFRESKVLPVDAWTLIRVSFESEGTRCGAEKVEGEWRSSGRSLSSALPEELVDKVARAEVRKFLPRKEWVAHGLLKAREKAPKALAKLEIRKEKDSSARTFTFYAADPLDGRPVVAVEVSGRGDALLVDKAVFEEASQMAERLRAASTATAAGAAGASAKAGVPLPPKGQPAPGATPAPSAPKATGPASPTPPPATQAPRKTE